MKRLFAIFMMFLLFITLSYGLEVSTNTKCEAMRDHVFTPHPKALDTCMIDDSLQAYIDCRDYYNKNMMKGLDSNGEAKVNNSTKHTGNGGYSAVSNYLYFDKSIKEILLKEVKKQIDKSQGFMCIENTEDSLFSYQESIAEHEWCYAPNFLKSFNDEFMSEHEMKYNHFLKLYDIRSNMLESKEKPTNKGELCGVYLECMSSFIYTNHTQVSRGLSTLYENTKKECKKYYFLLTIKKKYSEKIKASSIPMSTDESIESERYSEQIMYISGADSTITLMPFPDRGYSNQTIKSYTSSALPIKIPPIKRKYKMDISHTHGVSCPITHTIGVADDNKASIRFLLTDHRLLDKEIAKTAFASVSWSILRSQGSWSYESPSIPLRKKTHQTIETFFTMIGLPTNIREYMEYTIHIRPASAKDIKEFNNRHNDDFVTIVKAEKALKENKSNKSKKKRKNHPDSLLGNLQESLYNSLSQEDKDAWNKSDKEFAEEVQSKKNAEEFDSLSIDDLKMFSQ